MFGPAATRINNDYFAKQVSVWPPPSPRGNRRRRGSRSIPRVPDQGHAAPAGRLVRAGPEVASAARSSLCAPAAAPGQGRPFRCRRGRLCLGALFVVASSRAAAPRGDCAGVGASAQTGAGSRGLRPRETAAPGGYRYGDRWRRGTANGRAPAPSASPLPLAPQALPPRAPPSL